jgi:GTP-binding protein Era
MATVEEKTPFRSGFVAIVGRPNVGKSTLLNALLGEKIAIVSPKPQTTRTRILGVKHLPNAQVIFLDTPGIHKAKRRLNEIMVRAALATYREVDLLCVMVEPFEEPGEEDRFVLETLREVQTPVFLLINKVDLVQKERLLPLIALYQGLYAFAEIIPLSALRGEGIDDLVRTIVRCLPEGPRYFPEDQMTDQPERFIAAEFIREQIFLATREEVPYATAVMVEEFREEPEKPLIVLRAVIYVERDSQKGILIGKGGAMLKQIGRRAREEMERLLGSKVYLELWVKVRPDWRERDADLRELGYE